MVAAGRIPAYFDEGSKAMMALIRSPGEGEGFVAGDKSKAQPGIVQMWTCS